MAAVAWARLMPQSHVLVSRPSTQPVSVLSDASDGKMNALSPCLWILQRGELRAHFGLLRLLGEKLDEEREGGGGRVERHGHMPRVEQHLARLRGSERAKR